MATSVGAGLIQCNVNLTTLRSQDSCVQVSASPAGRVNQAQQRVQLNSFFLSCSVQCGENWSGRFRKVSKGLVVEAKATAGESTTKEQEEYEVELEQPIGLKFFKGVDGGTYIDAIAPGYSADKSKAIQEGDKVLATSAVFGTDMWPAAEYGRTMYTIRQRIGTVAMKLQKRYGKREDKMNTEKVAAERNAGQIGEAVREIQIQNYLRKMEMKKQREEELNSGLKFYKDGKHEEALERFETVLGLRPEGREEAVASYNVACCYSKLNKIEAGLQALGEAMEAGFDDYKTIRNDPDLENLRSSPAFIPLLNKYDEPFINENAMEALKSVFGIFGRK